MFEKYVMGQCIIEFSGFYNFTYDLIFQFLQMHDIFSLKTQTITVSWSVQANWCMVGSEWCSIWGSERSSKRSMKSIANTQDSTFVLLLFWLIDGGG